jgi:ADP-ribose pyrophosphatase
MPAIRVLSRRRLYQGRVFDLVRERLRMNGQLIVRDRIEHPGAVVIVPMLDASRIVFVRQYRRAVRRLLLELPAGTLAPGEPRVQCARRELIEETGWRARRWTRLGTFFAAPGVCSEALTAFLAQDLSQVGSSPEPDEWLEPVVLTLRQALRQIDTGAICDAKSIVSLYLARKHLGAA